MMAWDHPYGIGHPIEYVADTSTNAMTWDHMLFRFTVPEQHDMIRTARHMIVGESAIRTIARHIAREFDVPLPDIRLHARRRPCNGRYFPPSITDGRHGHIRLGRDATVEIIAHEMAHHIVEWDYPRGTAAHGRVWAETMGNAIETIRHDFGWTQWHGDVVATIRRSPTE